MSRNFLFQGDIDNPSRNWLFLSFLVPGGFVLLVTFLFPLAWLLRMSLSNSVDLQDWTVAHYASVFSDRFYWKVVFNTVWLGVVVACLTVLISYPLALFLVRTQSRWRGVLVALAVAPLLTSTVVRTYGWMVILGSQGLVNSLLTWSGLTETPLPLANNFFAAVVALVEILMPYAILSIMSGLGRLNADLENAAASLGANPVKVFTRVVLPLSIPGIATATLLVFVLAISSFVTPRLVGGGRVFVLATEIFGEATVTLNWSLAATLSMVLLVLFSIVIVLYQRVLAAYSTSVRA
jgi:putative spermidine/putrescine transport system permease protein